MTTFADSFVETGADVALTSHTPSGSNPATSWVAEGSGSATVKGSSAGYVTDAVNNDGNRFTISDALAGSEMDVQADFFMDGTGITPGTTLISAVLIGAHPSGGAEGVGIEAGYDLGAQHFYITDGTTEQDTVEAWPGGTVTLKLEVRTGAAKLYADGVLKVTLTSPDLSAGGRLAGLAVLDFDQFGTTLGPGLVRASNFSASDPPAGGTTYTSTPNGGFEFCGNAVVGLTTGGPVFTSDPTGGFEMDGSVSASLTGPVIYSSSPSGAVELDGFVVVNFSTGGGNPYHPGLHGTFHPFTRL